MSSSIQEFFIRIGTKVAKDSDLPNFFVYYLTIELGASVATVAEIRKCYEDCDLHAPSWLASHFSAGLRSKPKRFVKKDRGYRLESKLREKIARLIGDQNSPANHLPPDEELAGIQYLGIAGGSKDCEAATLMLLQSSACAPLARVLTCGRDHCVLLSSETGDPIVIKSGFSSGYGGTGPAAFSYILQLLNSHQIDIEEYEVERPVINRADSSALTMSDLKEIDRATPVRPSRWPSYVDERDHQRAQNGSLWEEFPPVIPFAIIDRRVMDLALSFWKDPDDKLLKGYRRLEDLIRRRTGVDEHGTKLLSQAFVGNKPKLSWKNIDESEKIGRANLFTGAYMAYRNPRAHRELEAYQDSQLAEFLLLNQLYRLEREAHLTGEG